MPLPCDCEGVNKLKCSHFLPLKFLADVVYQIAGSNRVEPDGEDDDQEKLNRTS